MKIGAVIADEKEFSPFLRLFSLTDDDMKAEGGFPCIRKELGGAELFVVLCGIGKVNAAAAAATLIHRLGCETILNAGLSGGLKAGIASFVVSKRFVEHDFDLTPIGRQLGEKPGEELFSFPDEGLLELALELFGKYNIKAATLGSGDSFISSSALRDSFIEKFDEDACDMESAAISSVCRRNGVPFIAFRKISDNADEGAADAYNTMNDLEEIDLAEVVFSFAKELAKRNGQ